MKSTFRSIPEITNKMLAAFVFFSLFLYSAGRTNIPETTKILFELLDANMTRNEASLECNARGGRLANVYDEIRKFAVSLFSSYLVKEQYLKFSFWIGLHDVNTAGTFKWSDCSLITTSYWSNTTQSVGEYCVSANPTDLSWQIRPCTNKLPAICEIPQLCGCSIDLKTTGEECANLENTVSTTVTGISEEACKIKCLLHVRSNDQCWALSYDRENSTCYLHERLYTTTTCTSGLIYYIKGCFAYKKLPQPRLNVSYTNNQVIPETTCTEQDAVLESEPCNFTLPSEECDCQPCVNTYSGLPDFWANSTLKEQLDWLVTILKVDKSNTSLMKRSKSSAPDSRITAASIGYAGAAILILIVGGIVILDLNRLSKDIKRAIICLKK